MGDLVIEPGSTPGGVPEPHPFGPVLSRLMDLRGITVDQMARRSLRSMSTIHTRRNGGWNPHRILVAELAAALDMTEQDLLAVAGLDSHP